MFDFVNYSADKLQDLVLIVSRASGLFILAPIFSDRNLPARIRVMLVLVLSLSLMPIASPGNFPAVTSLWALAALAFHELLVGVMIGVMFIIIFWAAQSAGAMVGYQIGFAMVTMMDPSTQSRVSIIGQFWYMVALVFFLAINGHHLIINSLVDSYKAIPIGAVQVNVGLGEMLIKYTASVFVLALKIASPVMVTLFLVDVALGTVAKLMPTMNVFFVGFPVKIAAGLIIMAMSLPVLTYVMEKAVHHIDDEMHVVLLSLGKA